MEEELGMASMQIAIMDAIEKGHTCKDEMLSKEF